VQADIVQGTVLSGVSAEAERPDLGFSAAARFGASGSANQEVVGGTGVKLGPATPFEFPKSASARAMHRGVLSVASSDRAVHAFDDKLMLARAGPSGFINLVAPESARSQAASFETWIARLLVKCVSA